MGDQTVDTKRPWQSKTVLVNGVLGLIAAIAIFVPGADVVHVFIESHAAQIGMIWSMLNLLLRALTKDKLSLVD